jgi:hypothetical protein
MAKGGATTAKRAKGSAMKNQKGKTKAHAPKAVVNNKRRALEEDNITSDEETPTAHHHKKTKHSLEVDEEVDDEVDEPEIELVEDEGDGSSGKDSNEVL